MTSRQPAERLHAQEATWNRTAGVDDAAIARTPESALSAMPAALILAAGEGRRLGPLTERCPKPLVPIAGRAAMFWILDWLWTAGVPAATINVHYRPEAFYETLRTRYRGMPLCYRHEPTLLGSGGTLRSYLTESHEQSVLVVYGDVLTTLSLARLVDFHRSRSVHPSASLVVQRVSDPQTGGVVAITGDRIGRFEEKPSRPASSWIFGGVAAVDGRILPYLSDRVPLDLGGDVFPSLCTSDFPLYAYPLNTEDTLIDFGTPERYRQACREWPKRLNDDPVSDTAAH